MRVSLVEEDTQAIIKDATTNDNFEGVVAIDTNDL